METQAFNIRLNQSPIAFAAKTECDVHHVMVVDFRRYFVLSF